MILAGDNADKTQVRTLVPPAGSEVGDVVYLQGQPKNQPAKVLSGNVWTVVVPELKVAGGKALYKDKIMVTDKGEIAVPDLADGSGIH